MQAKLLDSSNNSAKPDTAFLEAFADIVGSHWPSLASALSLKEEEIEDVTKRWSYFSSLKRMDIGATVGEFTGCGLWRHGTKGLRLFRQSNSSTKTSIMYCIAAW